MGEVREPEPWREARLFILGPGIATLAIAAILQRWPPTYPVSSQGAALSLTLLAPLLAAGVLGVFLSTRVGFSGAPHGWAGWRRLLLWSVGFGACVGIGLAAVDATTGLSVAAAHRLGVRSLTIPFPASVGVYAAGAVVVECFDRLAPIPIVMCLAATVLKGPRARRLTFWSLAAITSLIEPAQQAAIPLGGWAPAAAIIGTIYGVNLAEAYLFRRYGWPAPVATRLTIYLVWHVAWPVIAGLSAA